MYNISMLSKDQVLALINQSAGLSLTWDQVEFGEPIAATGENPERNTELLVTGIKNSGYAGSAIVHYNRIDLAEFLTLPFEPVIQIEGEPTIEKIVTYFNELYGANLQLDDVRDDHEMPVDIEEGVPFILRAAAGSYAYRGNVELVIQPTDTDLDIAIEDKMLDGLYLQTAPLGDPIDA